VRLNARLRLTKWLKGLAKRFAFNRLRNTAPPQGKLADVFKPSDPALSA
jgi:hypothetical protein